MSQTGSSIQRSEGRESEKGYATTYLLRLQRSCGDTLSGRQTAIPQKKSGRGCEQTTIKTGRKKSKIDLYELVTGIPQGRHVSRM